MIFRTPAFLWLVAAFWFPLSMRTRPGVHGFHHHPPPPPPALKPHSPLSMRRLNQNLWLIPAKQHHPQQQQHRRVWNDNNNNRNTRLLLSVAVGNIQQQQQSSARNITSTTASTPAIAGPIEGSEAFVNVNGATAAVTSSVVQSSAAKTKIPPFPIVLWQFTRPHTLIGSALAIPALHLLAAPTWASVWTTRHLVSILLAMVPSLLMNLYVTGLNQITDVEIDKINKPNLPMAAGILKRRDAIATVLVALGLSLGLAAHPASTQGLTVALWGSALLGTVYSLEPFRFKRFPLLAAFCIVAVRGTIINAGFFAHAQAAAFGVPHTTVLQCLATDPRCFWSTVFFGIFGVVIALMKDVPDVLGDRASNVRTFSVRVGPTQIFHASRRLLTGLFVATFVGFASLAATTTTTTAPTFSMVGGSSRSRLVRIACRSVVAVGALVAAASVRKQAARVDPENPEMVYHYYMHLWKLFYACYLALPLAR